jgi:RNA polymerase II subunit A small phosphatase-like protein
MQRKLVVLDIDETLVKSNKQPNFFSDFTVFFRDNGEKLYVTKRPYLDKFLAYVFDNFDVAFWSSGDIEYVNAIVKRILLPHQKPVFVYGKDKCTVRHIGNMMMNNIFYQYVKRLKKVWRRKTNPYNKHNTIMIDDTKEKAMLNYGNLIEMIPYHGFDLDDIELKLLIMLLKDLKTHPNIREARLNNWRDNYLLNYSHLIFMSDYSNSV